MSGRTRTVLTTVANRRQARRIAQALLEQQLAACVHIAPIESAYRWQGKLLRQREFQLAIHTSAARAAALQAALLTLHPYELAAIEVVAPMRVHAPYARWVLESTGGARATGARRRAARNAPRNAATVRTASRP